MCHRLPLRQEPPTNGSSKKFVESCLQSLPAANTLGAPVPRRARGVADVSHMTWTEAAIGRPLVCDVSPQTSSSMTSSSSDIIIIIISNLKMKVTLGLVCVLAVTSWSNAASVVDHHTVKMHTAFIKARTDQDFSHWSEAFEKADYDGDGRVRVGDSGTIFMEHYNIYHDEKPRGEANQIHFEQDAKDFLDLVSQDGWGPEKMMTEEEFMDKMHIYVDLKLKERGGLYDIAAHIF